MGRLFSGEAFAVIRVRDFRLFLAYRFFMTAATLMQSVVVGWHIYKLTGNVFALGLIGLAEVIPQVSIALFAGHFADIWNRKKIISYTTFILLLGSAWLSVYCIPGLSMFEKYGVVPIFITIFLTGLSRGILMPAHSALLGQLVDRKLYANAATWNSTVWHIAAVIGPAVGGLIYGFTDSELTTYVSVFTLFLTASVLITLIKNPPKQIKETGEGIFISIKQGVKFVFDSPILLGAFSLDMFAVLFGGAVALLPVFAKDILQIGPQGLGILRACPAIGAILMSSYLMFQPPVKKTGRYLLIAVSGFGLCMIGFALSTSFVLSLILLFLSGMFDNVSVVIRGTILQLYTPDEMKGRVASVNSIFIGSSNELGAFESGTAARIMGLVPSVIFGGAMTLLVVGVITKVNPVLRRLSFRNKTNN
jgi:MFS family permease